MCKMYNIYIYINLYRGESGTLVFIYLQKKHCILTIEWELTPSLFLISLILDQHPSIRQHFRHKCERTRDAEAGQATHTFTFLQHKNSQLTDL